MYEWNQVKKQNKKKPVTITSCFAPEWNNDEQSLEPNTTVCSCQAKE